MEPTDRELMARLARGDREALGGLMERHYRRLYRIALAYLRDADEALDAAQETFVRAFENAARWDGSSDVAPWLVRIAVNHSIDRYRRRKRRRAVEEPLAEGDHDQSLGASGPSPDAHVLGGELARMLDRALRTLPEKQRAVVVLRHYDEMSLEEIARTLNLSLGTVKSSLHRALHRLRGRLAGVAP